MLHNQRDRKLPTHILLRAFLPTRFFSLNQLRCLIEIALSHHTQSVSVSEYRGSQSVRPPPVSQPVNGLRHNLHTALLVRLTTLFRLIDFEPAIKRQYFE